MRACRHCSHQNADHLSYCSQCGKRLVSGAMRTLEASRPRTGQLPGALGMTAAFSPTLVGAPTPARRSGAATVAMTPSGVTAPPPARRSRLGWMGESIGYIYVYLRGRLDAEERRRRLTEERTGAEAMLTGAYNELALSVLRDGVTHRDLTGLLEAIGRAQAKREAAAADMAAGDALQQAEATRLGAQEAAAERQWSAADAAARDADDILRATATDRRTVESRLGKVKDERARLDREAGGSPLGAARNAEIAHEAAGLAAEQASLEERLSRLEAQVADLRGKSATARSAAAAAKKALEQAVAARRQAASAMAASIAGRQRDRAEAEREVADLTAQLGRAAAQARPPHAALLSTYQNIDRLSQMISERSSQLALLAETSGRYDQRKLLTGLGLLTTMLVASAALLWVVLR